jgi:hypothetical protein
MRTVIEAHADDVDGGSSHKRREFGWSIKAATPKQRKQKCEPASDIAAVSPFTPAEIVSYDDLLTALRRRADELQISRETINFIAGMPDGYAGKVMGLKKIRRIGLESLAAFLGALSVKLVMVVDEERLAINRHLYTPRDDPHTRSAKARHHKAAP